MEALFGKGEPLVVGLSQVLEYCHAKGGIAYEKAVEIAGDETAELILFAWYWKLIVPRRSIQCGEWDDRVLRLEIGEQYESVHVVKWLLDSAAKTGSWNTEQVVADLYAWMGEPEYEKMPVLVRELAREAEHLRIAGSGIHAACLRAGFQNRTGAMIAILKAGGVISPHLRSSSPMEKSRSPLYDVHPVLIRFFSGSAHVP